METILQHDNVLLYGCGGGYDIYSGLPLYWELLRHNKTVHLANCSFTDDLHTYNVASTDTCIIPVTGNEMRTRKNAQYFPEHDLAKSLGVPVYAVRLWDHLQIAAALDSLIKKLAVTCIVIIDAGHDAILFGDEKDIGSPVEDVTTVLAVRQCQQRMPNLHVEIACISAPTESMDFNLFLKQYAEHFPNRTWSPLNTYVAQFESILNTTPAESRSIPNESLLAAMKGIYQSPHYVNPRLQIRASVDEFLPEDYPPVLAETAYYYFVELDLLMRRSPFYAILQTISDHPIKTSVIYSLLQVQ